MMTTTTSRAELQDELARIPDNLLGELHEYMRYLQFKTQQQNETMQTAYASETVLGKDWNRPEEDQAWQDL